MTQSKKMQFTETEIFYFDRGTKESKKGKNTINFIVDSAFIDFCHFLVVELNQPNKMFVLSMIKFNYSEFFLHSWILLFPHSVASQNIYIHKKQVLVCFFIFSVCYQWMGINWKKWELKRKRKVSICDGISLLILKWL